MDMVHELKDAIRQSGYSLRRLGKLTGVQRMSLSRFMDGTRDIHFASAMKVAAFLGYSLCRTEGQPDDVVQEDRNTPASK